MLGDVLDEEGEAVAAEIGDAARYVHLDVTDEASWEAAVAACDGALHVLVNNAGILGPFTLIVKTSLEDFRRTLDINLIGTFLGLKHGGAAIAGTGGGAIVNISSISGMWGTPYAASYVSSKWAARGLTKAAALELGRQSIRVNSVHPGGVKTPMTARRGRRRDERLVQAVARAAHRHRRRRRRRRAVPRLRRGRLHQRCRAGDRRWHPGRRPRDDAAAARRS